MKNPIEIEEREQTDRVGGWVGGWVGDVPGKAPRIEEGVGEWKTL